MSNEYDWLDTYDSSRRMVTARDEVSAWVLSAVAMVCILILFGL